VTAARKQRPPASDGRDGWNGRAPLRASALWWMDMRKMRETLTWHGSILFTQYKVDCLIGIFVCGMELHAMWNTLYSSYSC
jgi:hypothetical protein